MWAGLWRLVSGYMWPGLWWLERGYMWPGRWRLVGGYILPGLWRLMSGYILSPLRGGHPAAGQPLSGQAAPGGQGQVAVHFGTGHFCMC